MNCAPPYAHETSRMPSSADRTTKILTRDHDYLIIPNKKVADSEMTNVSSPSPLHQERMPIGLPYETPELVSPPTAKWIQGPMSSLRGPSRLACHRTAARGKMSYQPASW